MQYLNPTRRILTAAMLALAVVASACSSSDADTAAETSTTADRAPAAAATFSTFGSIEHANVIDAPTDTELTLRDSAGEAIGTGRADKLGSFIFRSVEPGDGYTVEGEVDGELQRSEPFVVLDEDDTPPQSLYDDQTMVAGLNYVKMRDGVELAATVRLPTGAKIEDGPFPTLIEYSGYEVAPPNDLLASITARVADPEAEADPLAPATSTIIGSVIGPVLGFAVVSVQIRGSGCSGGEFDMFGLNSIYDGYDIIETVGAQSWVRGGKVAMVGISYSGYSQLFVGGTRPPSLAALAPMSVLGDLYDGIGFPGGMLNTGFASGWLTGRQYDAKPAPEGGQNWARLLIEQGDERCRDNQKLRLQTLDVLNILEQNEYRTPALYARRTPAEWAERIDVPVFLVGGLQDEQLGSHWYHVIDRLKDNPDVWVTMYNGNHNDALSPEILPRWVEFLDLFLSDEVPVIPDFVLGVSDLLYTQLGEAAAPKLAQTRFAAMTDVEAARAEFRKDPRVRVLMDVGAGPLGPRSLQSTSELGFAEWPPAERVATRWSLAEGGALVEAGQPTGEGRDEYVSDPDARPTFNAKDGGVAYSTSKSYDWQPVKEGKGLGYTTAPLATDLVIVGPSSLDVRMAASGTNAEVQVTLSEVRPDGQETYLTSGWLRLSHRKLDDERSTDLYPVHTHLEEDAEPMVANEPVDVRIPIHPVAANLRAGSRIRITILAPGGDTPLWDFSNVTNSSNRVSVVRDSARPSSLVLPVVSGAAVTTPLPACNTLRGQPCRTYVPASNGG